MHAAQGITIEKTTYTAASFSFTCANPFAEVLTLWSASAS